jgi:F-type H+-transporting ATPase subunit gamma
MSHLMILNKQIQSIKKTKKITHAMRLIAMSLYAKLDKKSSVADKYRTKYLFLLKQFSKNDQLLINPFLPADDPFDRRPVIILISSMKGLCGSFNNNIFEYYEQNSEISAYQTPVFVSIGRRAIEYFEKNVQAKGQGELLASYEMLSDVNIEAVVQDIAHKCMQLTPKYSSILLYYNRFENFFVQKPCHTYVIAPQALEDRKNAENSESDQISSENEFAVDYIWEQKPEYILEILLQSFFQTALTPLLYNGLVAEQASRFLAMESATSNAERYIETLELSYNKLRQESITRELIGRFT